MQDDRADRGTALLRRIGLARRAVLGAVLGLTLLAPVGASAAPLPPAAPLTVADQATLQRIAAYLNSITTMTARFTQQASNGISTGRLWVERPGRMRFEYDPPSPIVLLSDSFSVFYYDKQLQEVSQVALKSTPAWFLLREPVTFGPEIIVTRFERGPDLVRVTVLERAHPDQGSLTMTFSENPLRLRQWTIVDPEGKITTVSLSDMQFGMALDPSLFQYRNPFATRGREP